MGAPAVQELEVDPRSPRRRASGRAPAVLWMLGAIAVLPAGLPVGFLLWSAFQEGAAASRAIPPGRLAELLVSTGFLTATVTFGASVIGVSTAWLTTRTNLAGRRVWSTLVSLPLVIPSYVGALALLGASGSGGVLTALLEPFGIGPVPVFRGFWAASAALTLWTYPFVHLLCVPALQRMDPRLEEAARGLGASRWRSLLTVVFPQLRPAMAAAGLLVALYTLSDFGAVSLLRYDTFTRAIYSQFQGRVDVAPALFLSGVLVVVALGLVVFERRTRGKMRYHADRPARPPRLEQLRGVRRVGATLFLTVVVGAALVLPAGVLLWWAIRGLSLGIALDSLVPETLNSALVASLAVLATLAATIPLATLTVRHRNRFSGALETIAWSTYSLPHLAVGLAFLVLALRVLPGLYQSVPLLVIAYLAMFLPQALGAAQAALRQVSPSLEEASRSLGRSGLATLTRVVLPIITPGLAAGAALVFLTVMKELPATLLLRPTGFETLAVRIWSAASESLYTRASAASLLLLAISAVPLYLLASRDLYD